MRRIGTLSVRPVYRKRGARTWRAHTDDREVHSKTKRASRTVPVVLEWQRNLLRFALKHAEGTGGLLFTRWTNASRDLDLACRKARVPKVSFNDLRRTHSTWMRNAGVSPSNVGAMMGHTTGAMVERVYDGRTPEFVGSAHRGRALRAGSVTDPHAERHERRSVVRGGNSDPL